MKLNEYFKISVFGKETKIVVLEITSRADDFINAEVVTKGTREDLKYSYVVGQSISKSTVYIVTSRDPELEGAGLRGFKFSSHSLSFLSSLWSK